MIPRGKGTLSNYGDPPPRYIEAIDVDPLKGCSAGPNGIIGSDAAYIPNFATCSRYELPKNVYL